MLNHRKHISHELCFADVVRGASVSTLVCRAIIVIVGFVLFHNRAANHILTAITTTQKSRQGINAVRSRGGSGVKLGQSLHDLKNRFGDNRIMRLLDTNPVCFVNWSGLLDLVIDFTVLALYHRSDVKLVFQNAVDGYNRPFRFSAGTETAVEIQSAHSLVFKRWSNLHFLQSLANTLCRKSVELQSENGSHDFCGCFINDKVVLVIGVFEIPVSGKAADKLSVLSFHIKLTADFDRNVSAVGIVNQVLKRNDNLICITGFVCTVIMVIDRYKANTEKRKNLFKVSSCFNVISSETG